jgi:hypothetical protein
VGDRFGVVGAQLERRDEVDVHADQSREPGSYVNVYVY